MSIIRLTGKESFTFNTENLDFNLLGFWQWSSSDLLMNTLRGVLAEYIVASAINQTHGVRKEWDAYDLITTKGIKIEVKSSAYLQSWEQAKLSDIGFDIKTKKLDNIPENESKEKIAKRHADLYIFCVLTHQNKATVNPLSMDQWNFYILETKVLDKEKPTQGRISLSSLMKLNPIKASYTELVAYLKTR